MSASVNSIWIISGSLQGLVMFDNALPVIIAASQHCAKSTLRLTRNGNVIMCICDRAEYTTARAVLHAHLHAAQSTPARGAQPSEDRVRCALPCLGRSRSTPGARLALRRRADWHGRRPAYLG